jgi:acyl-CoA thioester hydrolase
MADITGFEIYRGTVLPEWIDYNKHMNVAYYVLAFDEGVDSLWDVFGITADHIRDNDSSTFAVESHVNYLGELKLDDPFIVTTQVLAYDNKRIHQFQRMYHAEEGYLAATAEWMNLHVDLKLRKVAPWPEHILGGIRHFVDRQGTWPWPEEACARMMVKKPLYSARDACTE